MDTLLEKFPLVLAGLWGLWQLGNAIARLTPNKRDDAWADTAHRWLEKLASLGLKPSAK